MTFEQIDALDDRAKPEDYKVTAEFPYWTSEEDGNCSSWVLVQQTKVTFLFRGLVCHGISNHEDGMILWNEEGWCDPDVAWADFIKSYQ